MTEVMWSDNSTDFQDDNQSNLSLTIARIGEIREWAAVTLITSGALTALCNGFLFYLFTKCSFLQRKSNIYLFNLGISDLLVALVMCLTGIFNRLKLQGPYMG